ncbi:proline--tRNA ligase [Sulfolobus acidocaldarius]|uniref:Proline--tRNA ligase n=4 Tax=Sulfolobus acidocaldarius TaxID=2285 RepID=SYP_SULAC|nr:proline--tRNA ligase [Sulfolobus acidocaldarius]Q4J8L4.1 RecName: Full=Proline--tRNA ligase; AltName: Full=Prolyl-tRNA synthetase; Short=ProRS [Sulfolobus acidocaldarius DSM 639]AAY80866.1 bifunctional aminoacyl-tRNA synthetase [Sulfolobus acidocaldarius DSM 639]AGE71466.1 prolyl-tRNA synthetase [Sulfolobus acidocaldarius N8]AGE73739.1 prolyl-tRNA synthetase [Sulfolobus acidocaldarius Ron12/I]ALU30300.1 proline--tRNA ligase [Sulfolobus acidocaldarius]ALU31018.1 proline--tRNA ligase [Sulfol
MKLTREKWENNFSEWFDWVIREAEIYDYGRYPVKGMGVWLPYGFKIRQAAVDLIRKLLDAKGHEEVLFPLLVPEDLLRREGEHIKGFESEVFWVTKGGEENLDIRLALRPTSETAITYMETYWVQSYKQLPKKYYQIVSVFRYETKATRPMIRLREVSTFKEAHTLHETYEDAERQVKEAIEIYKNFFEELGIPYIMSQRPEWDKFAGAIYTIAFDTIMPDSRVLQIGTVHHLGQHFTKAFDLKVQRKDGTLDYPHQTSYGISDRVIAVAVSINGDDHGTILSPVLAPIKAVIIPIPAKDEKETEKIIEYSEDVAKILVSNGINTVIDKDTEKTPGEKYYIWEIKGVPLRIEIGPRELSSNSVFIKRRDTLQGISVKKENLVSEVVKLLETLRKDLKERAWNFLRSKIRYTDNLEEAKKMLDSKAGIVEVPWCESNECGLKIEETTGARVLGKPYDSPRDVSKSTCVVCKKPAKTTLRLAKTY